MSFSGLGLSSLLNSHAGQPELPRRLWLMDQSGKLSSSQIESFWKGGQKESVFWSFGVNECFAILFSLPSHKEALF